MYFILNTIVFINKNVKSSPSGIFNNNIGTQTITKNKIKNTAKITN